MNSIDRIISVCICTYKRPEGLRVALQSLAGMTVPAGCEVELVVVDNDPIGSAAETVKYFHQGDTSLNLRYIHEATPGISHARNRCLNSANGEVVAFIDDDEFVHGEWLVELLRCMDSTHADAVFGPVVPYFEAPPPAWLLASGVNDRMRFATGTVLPWGEARTGNVMIRRSMVEDGHRFSTDFARTGGEDSLFFATAHQRGSKLVWCDEALVHETVPPNRMTRRWVLERDFNGGRTFVRLQAALVNPLAYAYYAIYGLLFSLSLIPPLLITLFIGHARHMKYARSLSGNLGKIVARFYNGGHYAGDSK